MGSTTGEYVTLLISKLISLREAATKKTAIEFSTYEHHQKPGNMFSLWEQHLCGTHYLAMLYRPNPPTVYKNTLDKYWEHQDLMYNNYKANIDIYSRSHSNFGNGWKIGSPVERNDQGLIGK